MNIATSILLILLSWGNLKPVIEFDALEHHFGTISQTEKVTHVFTFKNTGDTDLIIKGVSSSCGCTIADYTKEPIAGGSEGKIAVTFNPYGKNGRQAKYIHVQNNATEKPITLKIVAFVE